MTTSRPTRGEPREPRRYTVFATLTIAAAALVVVPGALQVPSLGVAEFLLWIAFATASSLLVVPLTRRVDTDVTLSAPINVAAAVVLSPTLVALIVFLGSSTLREVQRRAPPLKAFWNRSQLALAAAAASGVAELVGVNAIVATFAAVVVYHVINILAVAVAVWLKDDVPFDQANRDAADPFPRFAVDFGLVTLLAFFVVVAYDQVGPWAVALLAMPLWLGYSALRSARESEDRAEELADRVRELETLNELGTDLISARRPEEVADRTAGALNRALASEAVVMRCDGVIPQDLDVVKVPACEPVALGVPPDLSERSTAVVEAVAGLASMALQRLELEGELAETEKARRRLSEQILEEGQNERSRIALSIHDEVLPYLAAAEIQADNVRTAITMEKADRADRLAVATHDAVHNGIRELRDVLDTLRRQVLRPGELRPSLERALADLELGEGVATSLEAPDTLPPIPLALEILILETVRGCLANVARHARATSVAVSLSVDDASARVGIEDDGEGFDPGAVGEGHHGLLLMEQRVELARGSFLVDSAPGAGTRIRVEVPV